MSNIRFATDGDYEALKEAFKNGNVTNCDFSKSPSKMTKKNCILLSGHKKINKINEEYKRHLVK